jgi:chromosome segregation ATPase
MSDTPKVKTCPIYEAMSRKLLGCDSMPAIEKSKMMVRAIKAAKEAVAPRVIELERELAGAQAEIERLALEIENQQYTITCASEENQQLKESLAEARAEIEKLNKNHSDALDTILAMLIAARGEECDLETLEREMNAVSTKPSGYIRHCIAERDKLIEQMRDALQWYKEQVSSCNRNGDAGKLARDRLAKDVGKRAEAALSAAERINK